MTHDYKAALEYMSDHYFWKHGETIKHALRIAIAVTGEPSEAMVKSTLYLFSKDSDGYLVYGNECGAKKTWENMRDQMLKEIEEKS